MNPSPVQKQTRRWIINAFPLIYPKRRNLAVGSDPKKRKRISDQEEHQEYQLDLEYLFEIYIFIASMEWNLNKNLINRL